MDSKPIIYMYRIPILLLMLLSCFKGFSQRGVNAKFVSVKVYQDSLFTKLDTCRTKGISLYNSYTKKVEPKFKNYDLFFLTNKQMDSIIFVSPSFAYPLKKLRKIYKNAIVVNIDIFFNPISYSNVVEVNSLVGDVLYRENPCNGCNKLQFSSPRIYFDEKKQKFIVKDDDSLSDIINNNSYLFLN